MRELVIHWNELSIPKYATTEDLRDSSAWATSAESFFETFRETLAIRPNARISVTRGAFHEEFAGRTLLSWLEHWLGRDKIRLIKAKSIQPTNEEATSITELNIEVSVCANIGDGVTRAAILDSWVWSLASSIAVFSGPLIPAEKTELLADSAIQSEDIFVKNLSQPSHRSHWESNLSTWGEIQSESCTICQLGDYRIVMYPLDHGYPHIHVNPLRGGRTNKYRVDTAERLTDRPPEGLDALIKPWIQNHSDRLISSWTLCTKGKHPLQIT